MKRALITGVTGQDGLYLGQLLVSKGYAVFGLVRGQNNPRVARVKLLAPDIRLISGDLTDPPSLIRALESARPHEVYNLGAISSVPFSWNNPIVTSAITGIGALNVLEAIRSCSTRADRPIRFYQASSSEMFGKVQASPQREDTVLWPRSPYGAAKAFAHHMTKVYRESHCMYASSGILFNHESPLRGLEFVTRKVSRTVAEIALGRKCVLNLGNLEARRDWGFAGDYVRAMWLMLQQDVADDFIIATGESHSVADFVASAFSVVGIDNWQDYVVQDQRLFRPAEVDLLVGDASKARRVLRWAPTVGFLDLVELMVRSDIEDLQNGEKYASN